MAIIPIRSAPGMQRDNTRFNRKPYIDGQWCRFQNGLPRKVAGYRAVTEDMAQIVYGMHAFQLNATNYMHLGSASLVGQRRINNLGIQTGFDDRTPAIAASAQNIWQFDAIYDVNEADTVLVANVAPNMDIASDDAQPIWYGVLSDPTTLLDTTMEPVSGGVVTVGNYLVSFGSGGYVQWNPTANNLTAGPFDDDFITQQKIIRGLAVRGGGVPAACLWSLDTLLVMSLNSNTTPGAPLWDFDTVGEISVLSSRGIIEYDGVYLWPGVDRFLSYNGVIREVPNTYNVNFFFDRINMAQRQKCYAYKVPRFGEIWWCFPLDGATECNHAVVYNIRENYWWDTELPNDGRSDGVYAKVYFKPFMTGVDLGGGGYTLWQHETGLNQVNAAGTEPIQSHFETDEVSMIGADEPEDGVLRVGIIEPDFVQTGDITLRVKGRSNARSAVVDDDQLVTITEQEEPPAGVPASEQMARVKVTRRLMSFRFESNEPGGNYQMGHVVAHVDKSGERVEQ